MTITNKDTLKTREEIIEIYEAEGKRAVEELDNENCEYAAVDEFGMQEWTSSVEIEHDGEYKNIIAHYYADSEELAAATEGGDFSNYDWKISGYSVTRNNP